MEIKGSKILVLGGWGLVGSAICRRLMDYSPAALIVSSLKKEEADDAVEKLRKEYPQSDPEMFIPKFGNIFTREDWKDMNWNNILETDEFRKGFVADVFDELDDGIMKNSALNKLIRDTKPDIIIDCINTATAIAYLDIYESTQKVKREIANNTLSSDTVEKLMASSYIPQLIRHEQLLYNSMTEFGTKMYLKIGTSGTGGMGLNIPYTHSEERPSRVLLSKTAVAGSQTLLLFLMARTPNGPLVKEIKPTAAIAWKRVAYDKVRKGGQPIPLVDMVPENSKSIDQNFNFGDYSGVSDTGKDYESVFIDTGENGIFSKGEFQAIGALGQMEIVTPEEIAEYAVYEIRGGNTGRDVIQGLDGFTLGPTYRGGMLFHSAVDKIKKLEKEHGIESVAFELLGPPRLSKLLFEANLIKKIAGSFDKFISYNPTEFATAAENLIKENQKLRSEMLSIGLVVLLSNGKDYLRGKFVKIPKYIGKDEMELTPETLDKWCYEGWIDLRAENFVSWQKRLTEIKAQAEAIPDEETGSRYSYTKDYWEDFEIIDEGKIAGWIFQYEDKGWRFKR